MTTLTYDSQLRRLQIRQRMILLLAVVLIGGGLAMLINLASAPYPTEADPIINLPALLSTPVQAAAATPPQSSAAAVDGMRLDCIASQTGGFDCPGGLHIRGWRFINGTWEVIK